MKKYILLVILIVSSSQIVFGQTLLKKFNNTGDDVLESLDNLFWDIKYDIVNNDSLLIVRVCSKDTLPIAVELVSYDIIGVIKRYIKMGIPEKNIYFLRNDKKCKSNTKFYTKTEYWLVKKDAELPAFVEIANAKNLIAREIVDLTPTKNQSFSSFVQKIVDELKSDKTALVVITYDDSGEFLSKKVYLKLKKNVNFILNALNTSKIGKSRVYSRQIWGRTNEIYPNVTIIRN